jgi:hypothetical protein
VGWWQRFFFLRHAGQAREILGLFPSLLWLVEATKRKMVCCCRGASAIGEGGDVYYLEGGAE